MENYTAIELFAGGGGLALGMEQAGFKHVGLVEIDKSAAESLRLNRPEWHVINEDIKDVVNRDLEEEFGICKGELDLLSGGAPCQSFTTIGKRLGLEDVRGTLLYYYAVFLKKLQPKMFVFENVKGLLGHDNKRTYKVICDIFEDTGYVVSYQIMDAWEHGAPQRRQRLITIGIRKDLSDKCSFIYPEPRAYKPLLKDIKLEHNPGKDECAQYSETKKEIFALVPPGGCWKDVDPEIVKPYMKMCWYMPGGKTGILRRFKLDEPCFTIMTTPSAKQTDRCHPLEIRPFSYRENARIQAFPDDWQFCGSLSSKYKQVGNAVPISLAKDIGKEIVKTLNEIKAS